jgi:hypothetical protein
LRTQIADVKDETSCFKEFFSKFAKFREDHFKKAIDKATSMEKTFDKLFCQYRARGYKIPDMSTDKNLFQPCPLLLEDSKVHDYYKYQKPEDLEDPKDQLFLIKLNDLITEKLDIKEDDISMQKKASIQNRRLTLAFIKRFTIFKETLREQTTDFKNENERLEKENQQTRNIIRDYIENSKIKYKKIQENPTLTNSLNKPRTSFRKSTNQDTTSVKNLDKSEVSKDSAILSRLNTAMKTDYINTEKNNLKSPRTEEEEFFPKKNKGDSTKRKLIFEQTMKTHNSRRESMKTPQHSDSKKTSNKTIPSIVYNSNSSKKLIPLINTNKPTKILKTLKNKFLQTKFPENTVYASNQSKNRQSFLETKVDFRELERMDTKQFHKLIVEYCRILNYSEQKIEDILKR